MSADGEVLVAEELALDIRREVVRVRPVQRLQLHLVGKGGGGGSRAGDGVRWRAPQGG